MASMKLVPFLKSVVDNDTDAVVVCDLSHTMIYLNPAAVKRYEKRGGAGNSRSAFDIIFSFSFCFLRAFLPVFCSCVLYLNLLACSFRAFF